MKPFGLSRHILILVGVLGTVSAQEAGTNSPLKISATGAKTHVGAEATVTGKIAEVNLAERLVRLNFERPFPDQPFTAVIFAAKTNLFPEVDKLKGKTVAVTGKITEFRERPQIVLNSTNQLTIIEPVTDSVKTEKK